MVHEAAKYGQLACLKWLASAQGVRLDEKLCGVAAERGHVHVLQWLIAKGCTWDVEEVAQRAVAGGRREVLRWLREQGHPYDDDLADNAQPNADAAQQQPEVESGWSSAALYQKYFPVMLVSLFLLWWLLPDRQ
ncbi:Ankyrin repeat domain-containing protein [Balamuthia mandrillaris]